MSKKFFLILALGFTAASFVMFVRLSDFSREAWIVYLCATSLVILAIALFVQKNRRTLDAITKTPSKENIDTFIELLTGRSGKTNERTDRK
jgi:hypothetical protein